MSTPQTRGSAEALAAVLRESGAGLVLGSPTAGAASIYKEFSLSNNTQLRIASSFVKLGSGTELSRPLAPDIALTVSLEDERAYMTNCYAALHRAPTVGDADSTNRSARRYNEAELVRQQREGETDLDSAVSRQVPQHTETQTQLIADPVLSRGLDLVKGLAVIKLSSEK